MAHCSTAKGRGLLLPGGRASIPFLHFFLSKISLAAMLFGLKRNRISGSAVLILCLSESHLQLIHARRAPFLNIKSHLFKQVKHRLVFHQNLRRKTEKPLPFCQKRQISQDFRPDAFILVFIPYGKCHLGRMGGFINTILSHSDDLLFLPFFKTARITISLV